MSSEKMNDRGNWLNNIIGVRVCIYTRRFEIFFYKSRISLPYSRLSSYKSGITIGKLTYTDHLFLIWKIKEDWLSNTPPQVGEWISCTPNLRIIGAKISFPNGLVRMSASWCAELTCLVIMEPSWILSLI